MLLRVKIYHFYVVPFNFNPSGVLEGLFAQTKRLNIH